MKILNKHKLIFFTIFMLFCTQSIAADLILPLPRPAVDKELKKITSLKKHIYPQKKPAFNNKLTQNGSNQETEQIDSENKIQVFIYPKKKPIIVKKEKDKAVVKSKILSQKDYQIAKSIFEFIDKKKWQTAIKLSKKSRDQTLYKLVNYLYLKQSNNAASFYDYSSFIKSNADFPRISRLRYLAEHKINLSKNTPVGIIKWFDNQMPLSEFGKIKLGEAYLIQGDNVKGSKLIKEGWVKAKLTKNQLKFLRKKYKKIITVDDNIKRADWHAWEGKYWDVQRMLRYLPKDYTLLYKARQILMSQSYGVDTAISNVPAKFKNDIGFRYDRLKWRRRRGRLDPSLEILFSITNDPVRLVKPEAWWKERAILSRSLIYKKKYAVAYKVASNHSMSEGPKYSEAEWLSGWIALVFLDDPQMALEHFNNFYENVGYPISLSRGAYWLGRTYKEINNKDKSIEWFEKASKFLNTYYGQLAFTEINPGQDFSLEDQIKVSEKYKKEFNKNSLVKTIKILHELNKTKYTKDFLKHLSVLNIEKGSEVLAGNLAIEVGRYDFGIQIAKAASYEKRFYNSVNYPVIETPKIVNQKRMAKPEIVLAIIRQESEFDQKANSYVGARGMIQLMN